MRKPYLEILDAPQPREASSVEDWRGRREKGAVTRLFTDYKVYGGTSNAAAKYALQQHGRGDVTREPLGTSYLVRVRKSPGKGRK